MSEPTAPAQPEAKADTAATRTQSVHVEGGVHQSKEVHVHFPVGTTVEDAARLAAAAVAQANPPAPYAALPAVPVVPVAAPEVTVAPPINKVIATGSQSAGAMFFSNLLGLFSVLPFIISEYGEWFDTSTSPGVVIMGMLHMLAFATCFSLVVWMIVDFDKPNVRVVEFQKDTGIPIPDVTKPIQAKDDKRVILTGQPAIPPQAQR